MANEPWLFCGRMPDETDAGESYDDANHPPKPARHREENWEGPSGELKDRNAREVNRDSENLQILTQRLETDRLDDRGQKCAQG